MRTGLNSSQGFSLVEVMVAAASLTLVVGAFLEISNLRSSLLGRVKMTYDLSEVVVANVDEVKIKGFDLLPKPGDCLVRTYDRFGVFINEVTVTSTSPSCGKQALTVDLMEVIWRVSGPANINSIFTPAAFLKLPKYKASIIQLEIVGRTRTPPPGPPELTLSAVIFRK